MRRVVTVLASVSLMSASMVVAAALGAPALAAASTPQVVATGNSALPDTPNLLTANANGLVWETRNAANQPTLHAQKLSSGAVSGDPAPLTGGGWTRLTSNGWRPGLNLSIAGNEVAAAAASHTVFGSEQQQVSLYNVSTGAATSPIISGFGDGGGFSNQVFFVSAAPDGMLFLALEVPSSGPTTVHVLDEDAARDTPVDLGTLPSASTDPTALANVTGATSANGTVIAYPTTLGTDDAPKDNLAYVPYNGDGPSVLATESSGTFDNSLVAGGGQVAWANYLLGFGGNFGCNYFTLPLDGSGNHNPVNYNPPSFCDTLEGVTSDDLVLAPFPLFGGEDFVGPCPVTEQLCSDGPWATLDLLTSTVTKSTGNAVSVATDGTTEFVSKGTDLGTSQGSAGIYTATSATSAETLAIAAPAKPLAADQVALSPGRVTWSDDSTATYPVSKRGLVLDGTSFDLGTPDTVTATTAPLNPTSGYGESASGARTAYAVLAASQGGKDSLLVKQPDGSKQTVTTYTNDTPSLQYNAPVPGTVQVSGSNVLYLTDDSQTGYDAHVYSTATHAVRNFGPGAAFALSGGYLAEVGNDGSVSRQDLTTNATPVVLRPATTLTSDQTVDLNAEVAAGGDYVSWLIKECIRSSTDFTCQGNTEAAYRNAVTMTAATVVLTTPTTPPSGTTPVVATHIAMSDQYMLVDELNTGFGTPGARTLVAAKLADASTSNVTGANQYVSGAGKFAADGATAAWIDAAGEPEVESLDTAATDTPRVLTIDTPSSVTPGTSSAFEIVASTPLSSCSITISKDATTVRTLDCTAADGDGIASWDGTDGASHNVAAGSYTWTITGANGAANLTNYDGTATAITGTVNVVSPTTTTATWPASITYGKSFSVVATVHSSGATPTGTVTLKSGSTTLASKALSGGTATLTVSGTKLTPGNHTLKLSYGGSSTDGASSTSKQVTVAKASSKVTATWPSSVTYGKSFTVKVNVTATGTTPGGTVAVKSGAATLASHALSGGKATLTVAGTKVKPGKHTLTVSYGGSSTVSAGSTAKTVTVAKAKAKITESFAKATVTTKQHASLTVKVHATGATPTGKVRVFDGTTRIKTVALTAAKKGKAVISLPTLSKGSHKIHAKYYGSALVTQVVGKTITLTVTAK